MTAEQPGSPGATHGGEQTGRTVRSARSWLETRLRTTALGRFVMRTSSSLVEIEVFDRAMTLAAQAFTSILPLVIVVAALRRGDAEPIGRGLSNYLGLNDSAATALERVVPASSDVFNALGWFGTLLLIVSATAFSRALERFYARVWSKRKLGFRAAWRLFAVLATILLGLVLVQLTRSVLRGDGTYVAFRGVAEFVLWTVVWLLAGWIVLNRTVSFRSLLPGAVLCGIGLALVGGVGRIYLPVALASAAAQFGVLGITIAYVGWLFVLMSVVVIGVTIGRVLTVDYGVMDRVGPRRHQPTGADG
ncbi:YhjD/YihY/BrkB family envelope integrity protein [Cryobacterium sp. BB307]|uniref:YhjD/YihY/BrkB family envelope integrity protein n=1 Tax=Cryobacterium sp. BB307 TaxID=2716317 RepID=UPI001446E7A3|nr:YhjD/YihY/BrkB family envelope integrity protein [Cryobacterium sp. BB307]